VSFEGGAPYGEEGGGVLLSPDTLQAIAVAAAQEEMEEREATVQAGPRVAAGGGAGAAPVPVAPAPLYERPGEVETLATGLDEDILSQARRGLLLDVVLPITPHPVPISAARLAEILMIHT
jgi:hypothetical protein